jgi:predicted kinase
MTDEMGSQQKGMPPNSEPNGNPQAWPVERLCGATTSAIYRDSATGEWSPERAQLHEAIIARLLAGKLPNTHPRITVVTGGVGSGKSTLIDTEIAPDHPDSVVIDPDRMWLEIPEYESLANADWRTVRNRTYSELRNLRDQTLAEAVAQRLNIILETPGDKLLKETLSLIERDGYKVSICYVHCPEEEAHERMQQRATNSPTPEDNLWGTPPHPDFPDKYDYQDVDSSTFRTEYERRKKRIETQRRSGS